jgi:NADPH:quinone reductase-like Zn-dependent oxidoreductase
MSRSDAVRNVPNGCEPDAMKAIVMDGYGGTDVLRLAEVERPAPAAGEILIRVRAIGVNPADPKWRSGMFASFTQLNFPHVPGYDVAGEVEQVDGSLAAGTRVAVNLDALTQGGYAEFAVARAGDVAELPDGMAFEQAAAVPTPGLTGVQMIEDHLGVTANHVVLIAGATGSVGRFALIAARRRGAHIIAAVRAAQRDEARSLGTDEVLTLGDENWRGAAFDRVADTVGGAAVAKLCRNVTQDGMIITVATTPIPSDGLSVVPRFIALRPDGKRLGAILAAVARGEFEVPVARTLPLEQAAEAQRVVEAGGLRGKVVLVT